MPLLVTIHTPKAMPGAMTRHEFELGAFGDEAPLARAFGYESVITKLQPGGIARAVSIDGLRGAPARSKTRSRLQAIFGRWPRDQVEDLFEACAIAATPGARVTLAFI